VGVAVGSAVAVGLGAGIGVLVGGVDLHANKNRLKKPIEIIIFKTMGYGVDFKAYSPTYKLMVAGILLQPPSLFSCIIVLRLKKDGC
jgi:hypothetical protein